MNGADSVHNHVTVGLRNPKKIHHTARVQHPSIPAMASVVGHFSTLRAHILSGGADSYKICSRNSKAYARHPICKTEPELATDSEFLHEI